MVHFLSDLFIYFFAAVVAAAVAFFGALTLARLGFPGRGEGREGASTPSLL